MDYWCIYSFRKVLEPERHQNSRNAQLEQINVHPTETAAFTEINLGFDETDKISPKQPKSSPQANVKSVLVKGMETDG